MSITPSIQWLTWQEAKSLDVHPTAKLLPELLPEEFDALKQSIGQDGGVSEPVLLNRRKDTILDGRHRRDACVELKAEMPVIVYQGADEKGIVIARGLLGRHLTDDQRLAFVIAAELPELRAKAQERIIAARRKFIAAYKKGETPSESSLPLKSAAPRTDEPEIAFDERSDVDEAIAKKAGVSRDKARAAIKATDRDPKAVTRVQKGETRWKDETKPTKRPKPRKPKKQPSLYDRVWRAHSTLMQRFKMRGDDLLAVEQELHSHLSRVCPAPQKPQEKRVPLKPVKSYDVTSDFGHAKKGGQ
jgi:hypothetical protein